MPIIRNWTLDRRPRDLMAARSHGRGVRPLEACEDRLSDDLKLIPPAVASVACATIARLVGVVQSEGDERTHGDKTYRP